MHAEDELGGDEDTIYAVATGIGRSAIAIIRVSGSQSLEVARQLSGRVPPVRRAVFARLRDPASGEMLDEALLLRFEGAHSEVGEDGIELHVHGSKAVIAAVLAVLARLPGLRPAEPGEFARRAFRNGKMDLAQIEGLADLIDAETEWQRRQAQRQLSGAMREGTAPWRTALIAAAAQVETAIDFAEDVDLGATVRDTALAIIDPVLAGLRRELERGPGAERVRDGVQIVIAGPPNAGKSTLLNTLVRREAAIVSTIAGTTRDPIEVHLDLGGCPVTLVDTAGLRDASEPVEQIGVRRGRDRADTADLVLWLSEDGQAPPDFGPPVWRLKPKSDVASNDEDEGWMSLSARTGHNIDRLLQRLTEFVQSVAATGAEGLLARARHRAAFETAVAALDRAAATLPLELLAEELRTARFALDRLIGRVDVEDILGDIFSRFCIGK